MDVWWDSGVSHTAVCKHRPYLKFPADMYLEGSDQHRGWFMSSLMTSVGAYGVAPYKAVVSQGFTMDGEGHKMSKSLGNVIDPNKVSETRGADIIRLWVASVDTSTDVPCDEEILNHVSDAYRKIRNTFRFLLGELDGQFEMDTDGVAVDKLEPYDKLTLAHLCQVHDKVDEAYLSYRFNIVYRLLYDYVTELSNGYLNATKDRMYCDSPDSLSRRSAQTTWAYILSMLVHDLQPILAYTTDEVMSYLPKSLREGQTYAALLNWFENPMSKDEYEAYLPSVKALQEARSAFTKSLEEAQEAGKIPAKTSQAARAKLTLTHEQYALLTGEHGCDLAEPFVCSEVELQAGDELSCSVEAAHGERCPRCWNYRTLGPDGLCERCREAVAKADAD